MRSWRPRGTSVTWILVVLAYAVALAQRPGTVVADTKVHLYVEPARFLADVLNTQPRLRQKARTANPSVPSVVIWT